MKYTSLASFEQHKILLQLEMETVVPFSESLEVMIVYFLRRWCVFLPRHNLITYTKGFLYLEINV